MNHKWDEQYKLLSSASNKEIADLKNQIEMLKSVDNQRNPEIMEKIKVCTCMMVSMKGFH